MDVEEILKKKETQLDDILKSINQLHSNYLNNTQTTKSTKDETTPLFLDVIEKLIKTQLDTNEQIVSKLNSINIVLNDQIPIGKIVSIKNLAITGDTYINFIEGYITYPNNTKIYFQSYRPLISILIENEGANTCTILINPDDNITSFTLDSTEIEKIDLKVPKIKDMIIKISSGTTTLQISGAT